MVSSEIIKQVKALPDRYAGRVRPNDLDGMRSMASGGEWQELVDVLLGSLHLTQATVTASEYEELRSLAAIMKLPESYVAGLNIEG